MKLPLLLGLLMGLILMGSVGATVYTNYNGDAPNWMFLDNMTGWTVDSDAGALTRNVSIYKTSDSTNFPWIDNSDEAAYWFFNYPTDNYPNMKSCTGGNLSFWVYINDNKTVGSYIEISIFDFEEDEASFLVNQSTLNNGWNHVGITSAYTGVNMESVWYLSIGIDTFGLEYPSSLIIDNLGVECSAAPACNSSFVNYTSCGGYNSQMILTCENQSGFYDWSADQTYCPFGCYQGTCVEQNATCSNMCLEGSSACDGSDIVNCTRSANGCLEWSQENKTYCEDGCYQGACVDVISSCIYGDMRCSNNGVYNCTLNNGAWRYSLESQCTYGCEYYYSGNVLINATCSSVGDAHGVSNALDMSAKGLAFIFEPIIFAAFMFLSIAASLLVAIKAKSPEGGVWVFLLMLVLGTVIGPVPWYGTALFAVLFLGFKAFGGLLHG